MKELKAYLLFIQKAMRLVKLIGFDRGKMKLSVKALQVKKVEEASDEAEEASDSEE